MKTQDEKAQEIRDKRRLAEKGIRERPDGKPVDPMEDVTGIDPNIDPDDPDTNREKQAAIARSAAGIIGIGRP